MARTPSPQLARTANPHLLINQITALRLGPVGHTWILNLRRLPATLERLSSDRQLEESLATGGDPLHLVKVFAISERAAVRYAANAQALLKPGPDPRRCRTPLADQRNDDERPVDTVSLLLGRQREEDT